MRYLPPLPICPSVDPAPRGPVGVSGVLAARGATLIPMAVERRFQTGAREEGSDAPGVVLDDAGIAWLVKVDGTREQLGAGAGGSFDGSDKWALYSGNNVSVPDDITAPPETQGSSSNLTWDSFDSGAAQLDVSTPASPTIITAGVYAVTAKVTGVVLTADGYFEATLHLDQNNNDFISETQSRPAGSAPGTSTPVVGLACTAYLPAGAVVRVSVLSNDGASTRDFRIVEALVQRLS